MQGITITLIGLLLFASPLWAQTSVYQGESNEKLTLQMTPQLGKNAALVQFEGVPASTWQNKIIQVKKEKVGDTGSYFFEYQVELTGGKQKRRYLLLEESASKLIRGTEAKGLHLFVPGEKEPVKFYHDADLTKQARHVNLVDQYKKNPFQPTVD